MRRGAEAGYTLVELLVALVLFGFLSVLMALGYEVVAGSWRRLARVDDDGVARQSAEAVLRDRLEQAYPGYLENGTTERVVAFTGGADRMTFLAPLPQRFGAPALVWYDIRLAPDGTLHLAWRLDQGALLSDTVLLSGLADGGFSYYGPAGREGPDAWTGRWVDRTILPTLVRLHLGRADGRERGWPDLVVAPLIQASVDCRYDPSDGRCRG